MIEVLVRKQSAVMMSILNESKFWSVKMIHFNIHPEKVEKKCNF